MGARLGQRDLLLRRLPEEALSARSAAAAPLKRLRVQLTYLWCHHRLPRLGAPILFTEMLQHRKLHDRDPRYPLLSDKLAAKEIVAARLGPQWVIPTIWHGTVLPAHRPRWPVPFVVKSRHGCNQSVFVRSDDVDWKAIRARARRWTARVYGTWLDEWLYSRIPPGLLVEPFIGTDGRLPVDYKLFVFGGTVRYIQVHLDRECAHRWIVLDRDWRPLSPAIDVPARPDALLDMIAAAETLGQGFDFVRIDFYAEGPQPLFGEWTFYPGSGLLPFDPPDLDREMGKIWREARSASNP